jgi:uracil-DNA glycosylase family 4
VPAEAAPRPLADVRAAIVDCDACPRLRTYCARIAGEKRAAYRHDTYWARPVPGFGDPHAAIVLVGLAPAAHGANRTGRLFTGDVPGGSSDFLMAALHACGLASLPTSRAADDGLELHGVYITSAVRCAPPDNKPTPGEIARCFPHFDAEVAALPNARVFVALGRLAFDAIRRLLIARGLTAPRPDAFEHGAVIRCDAGIVVVTSYHPSRQNTQTGRLTPQMLREALRAARAAAKDVASTSSSDGRRAPTRRRTRRPLP